MDQSWGGLWKSPGCPSEPGELSGRQLEGRFLNAAGPWVIEGAHRGWLLEASITSDCLSHFWAFKSARCSCLCFSALLSLGIHAFVTLAGMQPQDESFSRALASPFFPGLGR